MQNKDSDHITNLKLNYRVIVIKTDPIFIGISCIVKVHFRPVEKMKG